MDEILSGPNRVMLRSDGVLYVISSSRDQHGIEMAKGVIAALRQLSPTRRRPLLLNITVTGGLTPAAREYYNASAPAVATAIAIVTTSTLGRVIANFLIALNEGVIPVRLFADEASALDWVREHVAAA